MVNVALSNRRLLALAGVAWALSGAGKGLAQDPNNNMDSSRDHLLLQADPDLVAHPTRILVKFAENTPSELRTEALEMVGGFSERAYSLVPGLEAIDTAIGADAAIAVLSGLLFVEWAEPDLVVHAVGIPNDTSFGAEWGMHNTGQNILGFNGVVDAYIDGPDAWDILTGNAGIVVAMIDTGINYLHVDLNDNIWVNTGETINGVDDDGNGYIDDTRGYDFYNNDSDPNDSDGHGTHTGGTVGAEGNNAMGEPGGMWDCQLMPLRFLGPGGGFISDAIEALNYAVNKGCKISNNSWGSYGFNGSMSAAISGAQAAGHIFVAAAGNDNNNNDVNPFYPASYTQDNVISVAGTNNRDLRYNFSNYGANSVDLGAPAEAVASTWPGNQYVYLDGTSMASPHVAGVVGLVWAQNPGWTATEVRTRVLSTARPINAMSGITVTGGMLNAGAALAPSNQPPPRPAQPTCTNLGNGQVRVDWVDNASNETRWQVQRQQRVNNVWTNTTMVAPNLPANTTTYTNTPGTGTWRYRIRSRNAFGFSQFSLWRTINVP